MSRFTESMFLSSLKTSTWGGTRLDRELATSAAHSRNADADAVSTHRILVPTTMLTNVRKCANRLRTIYLEDTSPWNADGVRILPAMTAHRFRERIDEAKEQFDTAVSNFIERYAEYIEPNQEGVSEAQRRMGDVFDPDDFPSPGLLRDCFDVKLDIDPMPDASEDDWRVKTINSAIGEEIRTEYAAKLERIETETRDYWLDAYQTLLERCVEGLKPKRILRGSTVEKLGRLAQSIAEGAIHLDPVDVMQSANRVVAVVSDLPSAKPNSPERINAMNELNAVLVKIRALQEKD